MAFGTMVLQGTNGEYRLGDKIAMSSIYSLYLCTEVRTGRQCFLQIAVDRKHNANLDRLAYILRELKKASDEAEESYNEVKPELHMMLNYDIGFPGVLDSFICAEQDHRRVNIFVFKAVEDPKTLVPLGRIIHKGQKRVDIRTSAWIMGKLLKMLVLTHSVGIEAGQLGTSNILIEPDEHYVVLFDWSHGLVHPEGLGSDKQQKEIRVVTRAVLDLLAADPTGRSIIDDGSKYCGPYHDFLFALAAGSHSDAKQAHVDFYQKLRGFGWKGFHPFTAFDR